MRNYVQPGDIVTVAAPYALASGDGALVGALFGVAAATYASGFADAEIKTTGVFDLKAEAAATGAVGTKAYWDDAAKQVTSTVGTNKLIGVYTAAKAASQTTARVRLNGVSV